MAWDSVPWFVGGGAQHSPEVGRLLANVATGNAEGIVNPTDLRVVPLDVPGASVRVLPGAALIPSRATDGASQSYVARNPTEDVVAVTATGSGSGRNDLIVARIEDPFAAGEPWADPTDPTVGPYVFSRVIPNVPASAIASSAAATAYLASIGQTAIPLAGIALPASTGTVTSGLITDLRKVARPQRTRDLYNTQPSVTTSANSTTLVNFAPAAARQITIPEWATQAKVTCHIAGMVCRNGDAIGVLDVEFGTLNIQAIATDMGVNTRATQLVSDTVAIPANVRGTTVNLRLMGSRTSGTGTFQTDAWSAVLWDVEFLEVASAD